MHIEANGLRLSVSDEGRGGPALVFLHYWGGSSRTWREVREQLRGSYRCIAYDHRGWGDSEAAPTPEGYHIRQLADDCEAVIAALGLDDYVLVGHSMGGKTAQLVASRRPAGLRALVLVAPAPATPTGVPAEARRSMTHLYESPAGVEQALGVLASRPLSAEQRARVMEDSLRGAPPARAGWTEVAMLDDVSANLQRIHVPTLVIAGEADHVEPVDTLQREVVARIQGARMKVLPATGHLPMLESPDALVEHIRRFVDETSHRAPTYV
ncbi:alpha/beta fold hydrolase [Vitiosangium sp. GDMCC 1.1324]|uniref:alpha/beta fold hydrolase n=1 Tax=Vitiosangium sp. (strain GDMCC 1.1324) TaxID=2138576 RepID=UPI000D38C62D|nr:alpha/beta hydrolase [Vitiosangium sp. GDMCC 1.1324]PTL83887.1 alpha/beta hydrolase [Vitiosangium sp. GDMCC 1.1324]